METLSMCFNVHQVKVMKIALAIAILRQKPEEVSVREYIEQIASMQQTSYDLCTWKKQAERLSKLLQLTQMIALEHKSIESDCCDTAVLSDDFGHHIECSLNIEQEDHIRFIQCISQTNQTLQNLPNLSQEASKTVLNSVIDAIDGMRIAIKQYGYVIPIKRNTLMSIIDTVVGVIMDDTMNCHRDTLIESCSQLSRTCIRQLQTIDNSKTDTSSILTLQHVVLKVSFCQEIYVDSLTVLIEFIVDSVRELIEGDCLSLLSMGLINSLGACLRLTELLMMDTDTTQTVPFYLMEKVESVLFEVDEIPLALVSFSMWRLHALMVNTQYD